MVTEIEKVVDLRHVISHWKKFIVMGSLRSLKVHFKRGIKIFWIFLGTFKMQI